MKKEHHCYPYDQFGEGPRSPLYLPIDVRGMADDPYRSLAWMVRKEGGYENSNETFAEFQWADLFRKHRLLESTGRSGFQRALHRAVRLAQSREAKDLPGYINHKQTRREMNQLAAEQGKCIVGRKEKAKLSLIPHALS